MRALLDVNVPNALLDAGHVHRAAATAWLYANVEKGWASCPLQRRPRIMNSGPTASRCWTRAGSSSGAGTRHGSASPHRSLERGYLFNRFCSTSQVGFVQRSHFFPTNIRAAFRSFLNCHRTQFEATFAHSPPPT